MFLIYDTETTGLPANEGRGKWEHPSQPWPVSVAALLLNDDLTEADSFHSLIRIPDDVEIHPRAEATHGISREKLIAEGVAPAEVLRDFKAILAKSKVALAYNSQFDVTVLKALALRLGDNNPGALFDGVEDSCLLRLCTNYLKIPGGNEGYRQVKLFQAYRRICGVPMDKVYTAHDAMEDVRACADIYRKMLQSMVV